MANGATCLLYVRQRRPSLALALELVWAHGPSVVRCARQITSSKRTLVRASLRLPQINFPKVSLL